MASVGHIKSRVRERDGHRCVDCGMSYEEQERHFGRDLHVHRLVPDSPYAVDGCVTLCTCCHRTRHGVRAFAKPHPLPPRGFPAGKRLTMTWPAAEWQKLCALAERTSISPYTLMRQFVAAFVANPRNPEIPPIFRL